MSSSSSILFPQPVNRYEPVWKSGRAFKPSIPQPYISLDMNGKDDSPPPPLPSLPPPPPPPSFDYDINDLPPPPPPPAPSENDQGNLKERVVSVFVGVGLAVVMAVILLINSHELVLKILEYGAFRMGNLAIHHLAKYRH